MKPKERAWLQSHVSSLQTAAKLHTLDSDHDEALEKRREATAWQKYMNKKKRRIQK